MWRVRRGARHGENTHPRERGDRAARDRYLLCQAPIQPPQQVVVLAPGELDAAEPGDFTLKTMPARFAEIGDRHKDIDKRRCSLKHLIELADRDEREGLGDAPWPPHYRKQKAEPPRVAPSKRRVRKPTRAT